MSHTTTMLIARAIISLFAICGYGYIVVHILTANLQITPELERLLIFVLGAITPSVITIVNWWFTSSGSSQEKNELLLRAQPSEGNRS